MAQIKFTGICSGTQQKVSKQGNPYTVTSFAEVTPEGIKAFDVFGDLGLPYDPSPREYVLEASITGLSGVKLVSGLPKSGKSSQ